MHTRENIFNNKDFKGSCCGCTACANICPNSAITMKEDKEGFLQPIINNKKMQQLSFMRKGLPIK